MPRYLVVNMGIKYKKKLYQHGEAITMSEEEANSPTLKKYLMLIPEENPKIEQEVKTPVKIEAPDTPENTGNLSEDPAYWSIGTLKKCAEENNIDLTGCKGKEAIVERVKTELFKQAELIENPEEVIPEVGDLEGTDGQPGENNNPEGVE
ncbi:MAG: hypothetical protein HY817_01535 [Candidatus Abawacabacteria bacterium]|nr:hypothetical protein [Candidatus Abawacabacteria bacterium]